MGRYEDSDEGYYEDEGEFIDEDPRRLRQRVVAVFTGNSINSSHGGDISRADLVKNIQRIQPDLLFKIFNGVLKLVPLALPILQSAAERPDVKHGLSPSSPQFLPPVPVLQSPSHIVPASPSPAALRPVPASLLQTLPGAAS